VTHRLAARIASTALVDPSSRVFATVALGPSRAAAAPVVRAMLARMPTSREAEIESKLYTVASFADNAADLQALTNLIRAGYGVRTLLFEVNGQTFTGANTSPHDRWIDCYAQSKTLGQDRQACPAIARKLAGDRDQPGTSPLSWKVGCRCLAAYAGGTIEPSLAQSVPAQLDALAARLGMIACPWFSGAVPERTMKSHDPQRAR